MRYLFDGVSGCSSCKYFGVDTLQCVSCINKSNWEPFPSEVEKAVKTMKNEKPLEKAVETFLKTLPDRYTTIEGRKETPERYVKALHELIEGYNTDIPSIFKIFDDIPGDQMVIVKDIQFVSLCEHHILPFFGKAHIGYIPVNKRVVGISKLARLFHAHAHRLQVQERIGNNVVADIDTYLKPSGVICVIEAEHLCMSSRGAKAVGSKTVTSALSGSFTDPVVRQEFYSLAGV